MKLETSRQIRWALMCYAAFLIYGSLMPFQFQGLDLGDALNHYLASEAEGVPGISWRDLLTNIALYIPLGLLGAGALIVSPMRGAKVPSLILVVAGGCLLSGGIEFLQLYFPPRVSWIYDLLGNGLGSLAGFVAWQSLGSTISTWLERCSAAQHSLGPVQIAPMRRIALGLAYLAGLILANHWHEGSWSSLQSAITRLPEFSFLPFYYYQEASTWIAVRSALWHFAIYFPLGAALLYVPSVRPLPKKSRLWVAAITGAGIASIFEAGKIFLASRHPDSGNAVVGALAAVSGLLAFPCILQKTPSISVLEPADSSVSSAPHPSAFSISRVLAAGILLAVAGIAIQFPAQPALLMLLLLIYVAALLRWPHAWLWVLPAALPVLDLAPYSGWFFLDEFDLLILVTLAVSIWQRKERGEPDIAFGAGYWLALVFALSTAISLSLGLLPLQPIDHNAFSHYFSHYNALRIAKGLFWTLLLAPVALRSLALGQLAKKYFSQGILIGLAGAALLAVWERAVYPGLLNFSSEFRIGAFFSSMHNGGSHIEAYFTMAIPFALIYAYITQNRALRRSLAGLFLISSYVVLVTFARGGYAAFAISLLIVAAAILRTAYLEKRRGAKLALGVLIASSLLLALPVLMGTFAQQRIAASGVDLGIRQSHWEESLRLMPPDISTSLFGMGLGRFPENYYFAKRSEGIPAVFRYGQEADNVFLTLGTGQPLYVEQIVDVTPARIYRLSFDTRSAEGHGIVNVLLCERTYFYAYGCVSATQKHESAPGKWASHAFDIASGELGGGPWLGHRAVKLSLENAGTGAMIDVDNIALRDEAGNNLVNNGGFEKGSANWFFASNFNHLPWHIKNLWIGLYFDQGWFGVLSFAGVLLFAGFKLARSAWRGNLFAGASLASIAGFLSVGLFDSLFDAPRLINLLFLTLFIPGGLLAQRKRIGRTSAPAQQTRIASKAEHLTPSDAEPPEVVPSKNVTANKVTAEFEPKRLELKDVRPVAIGILLLTMAVWLVTQLPQIPYNLRALPNPYHPLLAPLILASFLYWVLAAPAVTARWLASSAQARFAFPLWALLHGAIAWALLRNGVLPVMIHKVAGAPILGWSGEWETLFRFAILEGALFTLLTGGAVIARSLWDRAKPAALLTWLSWACLLLPAYYWVIVTNAATDNLVELIAGEGNALACLSIALWVIVLNIGAFSVARSIVNTDTGRIGQILLATLSLPLGYALLTWGLEPALEKFGQVFSGLQFLLSMDRLHYATGVELWVRYSFFHGALLFAIALAQYPFWKKPRPDLPQERRDRTRRRHKTP